MRLTMGNGKACQKLAQETRQDINPNSNSSFHEPMACAESITEIDRNHKHITSTDTLLALVEFTTDTDLIHEHITSIDILPDDALLQIFDFCQMGPNS